MFSSCAETILTMQTESSSTWGSKEGFLEEGPESQGCRYSKAMMLLRNRYTDALDQFRNVEADVRQDCPFRALL